MSESIESNKAVVTRFMGAAAAGDLDAMAECLVEDYVQIFPRPGIPGFPAGVDGRTQILEFLEALPVYEKGSIRMEIENLVAEGSNVVAQYTLYARTLHGEDYENYYVQVFCCRDGKIAKSWEYCDTLYSVRKLVPEVLDHLGS